MNAILFSENKIKATFIQKAFRSENIRIRSLPIPENFQNFYSDEHVFIFQTIFSKKIYDFVLFLKSTRTYSLVIYIGDEDVNSLPAEFDLKFRKPITPHSMAFKIFQKYFSTSTENRNTPLDLGKTSLDLLTREVCTERYRTRLRNKEFTLLQLFMMNPGHVFTRTDILELVWDRFAILATNTVDVHVSRIRKKLKRLGSDLFIKTIPCVGYILNSVK